MGLRACVIVALALTSATTAAEERWSRPLADRRSSAEWVPVPAPCTNCRDELQEASDQVASLLTPPRDPRYEQAFVDQQPFSSNAFRQYQQNNFQSPPSFALQNQIVDHPTFLPPPAPLFAFQQPHFNQDNQQFQDGNQYQQFLSQVLRPQQPQLVQLPIAPPPPPPPPAQPTNQNVSEANEEKPDVQLVYVPVEALRQRGRLNQAEASQQQFTRVPQVETPRPTVVVPITTTAKPVPHQPPLSVYMGKEGHQVDIADVIKVLKDAKTIAVLDSVGPNTPQVFVGPSNLKPGLSYAKFELPYLSSIDSNRVERKVDQLPFFVAPLNFKPPAGYSKIPFPAPHIGSVVISNNTTPSVIEQTRHGNVFLSPSSPPSTVPFRSPVQLAQQVLQHQVPQSHQESHFRQFTPAPTEQVRHFPHQQNFSPAPTHFQPEPTQDTTEYQPQPTQFQQIQNHLLHSTPQFQQNQNHFQQPESQPQHHGFQFHAPQEQPQHHVPQFQPAQDHVFQFHQPQHHTPQFQQHQNQFHEPQHQQQQHHTTPQPQPTQQSVREENVHQFQTQSEQHVPQRHRENQFRFPQSQSPEPFVDQVTEAPRPSSPFRQHVTQYTPTTQFHSTPQYPANPQEEEVVEQEVEQLRTTSQPSTTRRPQTTTEAEEVPTTTKKPFTRGRRPIQRQRFQAPAADVETTSTRINTPRSRLRNSHRVVGQRLPAFSKNTEQQEYTERASLEAATTEATRFHQLTPQADLTYQQQLSVQYQNALAQSPTRQPFVEPQTTERQTYHETHSTTPSSVFQPFSPESPRQPHSFEADHPRQQQFAPEPTRKQQFAPEPTRQQQFAQEQPQEQEFVPERHRQQQFVPEPTRQQQFAPEPTRQQQFAQERPEEQEFVPEHHRQQQFVPEVTRQQEFAPERTQEQQFVPEVTRQQQFAPEHQQQFVPEPPLEQEYATEQPQVQQYTPEQPRNPQPFAPPKSRQPHFEVPKKVSPPRSTEAPETQDTPRPVYVRIRGQVRGRTRAKTTSTTENYPTSAAPEAEDDNFGFTRPISFQPSTRMMEEHSTTQSSRKHNFISRTAVRRPVKVVSETTTVPSTVSTVRPARVSVRRRRPTSTTTEANVEASTHSRRRTSNRFTPSSTSNEVDNAATPRSSLQRYDSTRGRGSASFRRPAVDSSTSSSFLITMLDDEPNYPPGYVNKHDLASLNSDNVASYANEDDPERGAESQWSSKKLSYVQPEVESSTEPHVFFTTDANVESSTEKQVNVAHENQGETSEEPEIVKETSVIDAVVEQTTTYPIEEVTTVPQQEKVEEKEAKVESKKASSHIEKKDSARPTRRGSWVRVRKTQRPATDILETAESQNVGSHSKNHIQSKGPKNIPSMNDPWAFLLPGDILEDVVFDVPKISAADSYQTVDEREPEELPEKEEVFRDITTEPSVVTEESVDVTTTEVSNNEEVSVVTTENPVTEAITTESSEVVPTNSTLESDKQTVSSQEHLSIQSSVQDAIQQNTQVEDVTEPGTLEVVYEDLLSTGSSLDDEVEGTIRTSESTQVSHETEICYRGRCVKTKSKDNDHLAD